MRSQFVHLTDSVDFSVVRNPVSALEDFGVISRRVKQTICPQNSV